MSKSPAKMKDTLKIVPHRRYFGAEKPKKAPAPKKKPAAKKTPAEAPPNGEAPPVEIPPTREEIQAVYKFTPAEIDTMNTGLRNGLDAIEELQGQAKAAAQDFKLRIQNKQNETKSLRMKLTHGEETRPMTAAVKFDAKKALKTFLDPNTGAFVREEPMQPADWQLPMFRPTEDGKEKPAAKGEGDVKDGSGPAKKGAKAPKTSPAGETSVGDAMDKAAAEKAAPLIVLDLTKEDWTVQGLTRAFKKAATYAGWTEAQISTLKDRLSECETVEQMMDTLRPHTITPQTVDVNGVKLRALEITLEPGFPADKYRGMFNKAAKAAKWPVPLIEEVDGQLLNIAVDVLDEPEAGEKVSEHLKKYCAKVNPDPTDL